MNAAQPAPAGFWRRSAAWLLDALLLSGAALVLAWPRVHPAWHALVGMTTVMASEAGRALADALMSGRQLSDVAGDLLHDARLHAAAASVQSAAWDLLWPLLLGYALLAAPWHILGECSRWRGSAGKRALGLAVADCDGCRLSLPRAALRHVAGLLSWLTLNLGHLLAAMPPQRRALHDYIAGARVVQAPPAAVRPRIRPSTPAAQR